LVRIDLRRFGRNRTHANQPLANHDANSLGFTEYNEGLGCSIGVRWDSEAGETYSIQVTGVLPELFGTFSVALRGGVERPVEIKGE
jgi:hypothetical protein